MLPDLAGSARTQVAIVRTLIDEVEHAIAGGQSEQCMREQLVEELARLGSRLIDLAAAFTAVRSAETVSARSDPRNPASAAP